jgi:hypothetical protein
MVSTDGTGIRGKNHDDGGSAMQVGGHIDPASLQAMVRSIHINVGPSKNDRPPLRGNPPPAQVDAVDKGGVSKFDRYGRGIKLSLDSTPDISDLSEDVVEITPVGSSKI